MKTNLLKYFFSSKQDNDGYKLILAQFFIRHGARYCMRGHYLKGHPYYQQQIEYKGHLTPVGMVQQKRLGDSMRREYILQKQLLEDTQDINKVSINSSNSSRCLQSAQSFLQGFYPQSVLNMSQINVEDSIVNPPYESQSQGKNRQYESTSELQKNTLLAYPFPIRSFGINDYLLNPPVPKKKLIISQQKNQSHSKVLQELKYFEKELKNIKDKIGLGEDFNHLDASSLFDISCSQRFFGITYKITEFEYHLLNYLKSLSKLNSQYTEQYSKITISPLFSYLQKLFDSKIKNQITFNMIFGFTHDSRIVPLMQAFDLINLNKQRNDLINSTQTTKQYPPYCSSFIFELYEKIKLPQGPIQDTQQTDQYKVGVKYNGEYLSFKQNRTNLINYSDFQLFLQNQIVSDEEYNQFTGSDLKFDSFFQQYLSSNK